VDAEYCDEDEDSDAVPEAAAAPPIIDVASPRALAAVASSLAAAGLMPGSQCGAGTLASHGLSSSAAAEAALSPASSSSSSPLAAATAVAGGVDAGGWRVRHCGTLTHVFSHVIHRLQVLAVHLSSPTGPADSLVAASLDCAASGASETPIAGSARVPSDSAASTTAGAGGAADGAGVGRWVRPAEFGDIGLTTWAAKLLYAALLGAGTAAAGGSSSCGEAASAATPTTSAKGAGKAKGRAASRPTTAAAMVPEPGSAGVGLGVGSTTLSSGDAAGLELLRKRWRTTHGKLE